jgi:hypothetical protein
MTSADTGDGAMVNLIPAVLFMSFLTYLVGLIVVTFVGATRRDAVSLVRGACRADATGS